MHIETTFKCLQKVYDRQIKSNHHCFLSQKVVRNHGAVLVVDLNRAYALRGGFGLDGKLLARSLALESS